MPTKPPVHRPAFTPSREERLARLRAEHDARRPPPAARGYDRDWRKLRARFLQANPFCCVDGCGEPTRDVDHRHSIALRPDLRLVWENLRAFCHKHHSRHTARTQGFAKGKAP